MYKMFLVFPKKGYSGCALIAAEDEMDVIQIIKQRRYENVVCQNDYWKIDLDKMFHQLPDYTTSSERGVIFFNIVAK